MQWQWEVLERTLGKTTVTLFQTVMKTGGILAHRMQPLHRQDRVDSAGVQQNETLNMRVTKILARRVSDRILFGQVHVHRRYTRSILKYILRASCV